MSDTLPIEEAVTPPDKVDDDGLLSIDVKFPGAAKRTLRFKNLTGVPIGIVRETRNDNTEQMWRVFEWAFAAEDLAAFDELPAKDVFALLADMQKASKIELGESSASSTS